MSQSNTGCKPKKRMDVEDCDLFDPSVYTPKQSKYRADFIKRIVAKITAELDSSMLAEEAPEGEGPSAELEVTGDDPEKHLKFILKYLRGPRGFRGSLENFVVLSESEYERLKVKDPNIFYFTYEDDGSPGGGGGSGGGEGEVSDTILEIDDYVENHVLITVKEVTNNSLIVNQ